MLTLIIVLLTGIIIGAFFTSIVKAIVNAIKAIVLLALKAMFVFSAFIGVVYVMANVL